MINFEYLLAQNHVIKKRNWEFCATGGSKTQKFRNGICVKLIDLGILGHDESFENIS